MSYTTTHYTYQLSVKMSAVQRRSYVSSTETETVADFTVSG